MPTLYPIILCGDQAEEEANYTGDPKDHPTWPLPSFDARDWAEAFMKLFDHQRDKIDEELMIGWFANALMRGYDESAARHQSLPEPPK